MDDTNYKTGTYTYYILLLSLPGIVTNELTNILPERPPLLLRA